MINETLATKWVLLVITMWEPSMWINIHETTYSSMERCMEQRALYLMHYAKEESEDFHYVVGCSPEEN